MRFSLTLKKTNKYISHSISMLHFYNSFPHFKPYMSVPKRFYTTFPIIVFSWIWTLRPLDCLCKERRFQCDALVHKVGYGRMLHARASLRMTRPQVLSIFIWIALCYVKWAFHWWNFKTISPDVWIFADKTPNGMKFFFMK